MQSSGVSGRENADVYLGCLKIESESHPRHCDRSEAIHVSQAETWIASSLRSSQ